MTTASSAGNRTFDYELTVHADRGLLRNNLSKIDPDRREWRGCGATRNNKMEEDTRGLFGRSRFSIVILRSQETRGGAF
jgi:hypothetical protein